MFACVEPRALHYFDQGEVSCALECLRDVLKGNASGASAAKAPFQLAGLPMAFTIWSVDHVLLRLSEKEAHSLQANYRPPGQC